MSRNFTSPVWSAVQAWRNVSIKPPLANAKVSACQMCPLDVSDAVNQIVPSMNLRKSSDAAHQQSAVGCNVQ